METLPLVKVAVCTAAPKETASSCDSTKPISQRHFHRSRWRSAQLNQKGPLHQATVRSLDHGDTSTGQGGGLHSCTKRDRFIKRVHQTGDGFIGVSGMQLLTERRITLCWTNACEWSHGHERGNGRSLCQRRHRTDTESWNSVALPEFPNSKSQIRIHSHRAAPRQCRKTSVKIQSRCHTIHIRSRTQRTDPLKTDLGQFIVGDHVPSTCIAPRDPGASTAVTKSAFQDVKHRQCLHSRSWYPRMDLGQVTLQNINLYPHRNTLSSGLTMHPDTSSTTSPLFLT